MERSLDEQEQRSFQQLLSGEQVRMRHRLRTIAVSQRWGLLFALVMGAAHAEVRANFAAQMAAHTFTKSESFYAPPGTPAPRQGEAIYRKSVSNGSLSSTFVLQLVGENHWRITQHNHDSGAKGARVIQSSVGFYLTDVDRTVLTAIVTSQYVNNVDPTNLLASSYSVLTHAFPDNPDLFFGQTSGTACAPCSEAMRLREYSSPEYQDIEV